MRIVVFFILTALLSAFSCRRNIQENPPDVTGERVRRNESLIKMNNYVAKRNKELISRFVKRTSLKMEETGSGLWYEIYSRGNGKAVKPGDIVEITFYLRLLDGTPIDSASAAKPKSFRTGKGGVEAGLEEGVLLLHEGDSARFIIPPHLGFGNFGDQNKIPAGAFLFYDLSITRIKNQ